MASNERTPAPERGEPSQQAQVPSTEPSAVPSRGQLTVAFAQAVDLAEGKEPGHAARVCFIALNLAQMSGVSSETRRVVYYGALLHDAGAAPASAERCRLLNLSEDALFGSRPGQLPHQRALEIAPGNATTIVDLLRAHLELGAEVVRELGFDEDVQEAVVSHHEHWDGQGYPRGLKDDDIPVAGRIVSAADLMEALISAEGNPLTARRNLAFTLGDHAGRTLDPEMSRFATELARSDTFWLGLHEEGLIRALGAAIDEASEEPKAELTYTFARVFAQLADLKGEHTVGHAEQTAAVADRLAKRLGFDAEHRRLLQVAALVHDVGLLGVPARVIAKPDILSLTEMELMRKHPTYSQMVLEALPGLDDVTSWVGAHHERPDGRGYPEMLDDELIPVEARILALADTHIALTSPRPYRQALSDEDAQQVILGGAGSQLDRKLVQLFYERPRKAKSSRSAPRSARRR